ncbi:hypothetical protein Tco_1326588 [Tanacetum coccineum]
MVAYLQKSERSKGFHLIIDFLNASHIQYALTKNLTIYVSFIKQFWKTTTARTSANEEVELTATIDGQVKTITEASLRRHLKLEDNGGITTLPNSEIFEQLSLMGAPETSPSRITSSPSLSPQHTPVSTPQPPNTQPTSDIEEAVPMPHESPLHSVHSLGRDEGSLSLSELTVLCTNLSNKVTNLEAELAQTKQTYGTALTKLIKKVKKLEQTVKSTQARRRFRIVVSDDEEGLEDPSKQGRKITEIDQDPSISLVQDEGTSWIQEDIEIQEKISDDTEVVLEEEEPTELVEDQGSGEKGEKEVSTVGAEHSTVIPEVSTAAANLVYIRRSAQKRKDKGKAIMEEDESVQKKTKKQLEQERLGHEEAIRLQEQIDEEERQRIARDAEIAKQLQEEINKATQEQEKQEVVTEADPTHVIDWSDPAVIRYHALQNRAFSVPEVRKNMCMYLINQGGYKMRHFKGMSYEDIRPIFEKKKRKEMIVASLLKVEERKHLLGKRASGKDKYNSGDDVAIDIESLATKYPIVDWKTYVLAENFMYYQIFRVDGSSKNYKIFSEMIDDFDRQDVLDLHRIIKARYMTSSLEGYDLMLWGDLKTLFKPDEEDEV